MKAIDKVWGFFRIFGEIREALIGLSFFLTLIVDVWLIVALGYRPGLVVRAPVTTDDAVFTVQLKEHCETSRSPNLGGSTVPLANAGSACPKESYDSRKSKPSLDIPGPTEKAEGHVDTSLTPVGNNIRECNMYEISTDGAVAVLFGAGKHK